jgi:glycosyltransferase involved in cell wall biosynthesis
MGIEYCTVSILIPVCNAAATIGKTMKSASSQPWPHKEIIVVDDGSADHTRAIAHRCGMFVADQRNQGAAAARNLAYNLSRG